MYPTFALLVWLEHCYHRLALLVDALDEGCKIRTPANTHTNIFLEFFLTDYSVFLFLMSCFISCFLKTETMLLTLRKLEFQFQNDLWICRL